MKQLRGKVKLNYRINQPRKIEFQIPMILLREMIRI